MPLKRQDSVSCFIRYRLLFSSPPWFPCFTIGDYQKVVGAFAWVLRKFMNISGSEGLVAAGNIFMGMTESPVLIKNYLPTMNRSEIFLVMVSGMGTIAGSVMGTHRYVGRNRPGGEGFIRHSLALGFRNGSTGFNRFSENAFVRRRKKPRTM